MLADVSGAGQLDPKELYEGWGGSDVPIREAVAVPLGKVGLHTLTVLVLKHGA